MWLANKVSAMMDTAVERKNQRFESQLSPVAHLVVAYCLLQQTSDLAPEDLIERQKLARILVAKSIESRRRTKSRTLVAPLEHTLRALVHAHLENWVDAKAAIVKSLSDRMLQRPFHTVDIECIDLYNTILEKNGRSDDFVEAVFRRSGGLLSVTVHETSKQSIRPDLREVLFRGIRRIERGDKWLHAVLERERGPQKQSWRARDTGDQIEDGTLEIESPRFRYSQQTRAFGSLLFVVFSQQADRIDETMGILRQLFYHEFWISPHHVADFCLHLTHAKRQLQVLECYTRLVKAQENMSHSALRRMMYILLENGYFADAADVQDQIIKHHPASDRDKEAIAFYHANRGEVMKTVEALRGAFGDKFMRDIGSLRLLLEVNIVNKDNASADIIINTIAGLANSSTPHLNFLLDFYATRGKITQALALFEAFLAKGYERPNLDTFRALVRLFGEQRDMANVDRIVQAAVDGGITLDGPFCGQILEVGIQVQDWATVSRRWTSFPPEIKAHPSVITAVQKAFVYLAVPFDFVIGFFRQIRSPTADQWHLIILSACDTGRPDLGRLLLKEMDRRARYIPGAPSANRYIFTTLMHGYLRINNRDMAKKTFDEMVARNVAPSSITYAMIISSFLAGEVSTAKAEQAHRFAMSIWDEIQLGNLPERGHHARLGAARLFGGLVDASGKLRRHNKAQMYFDMISQQAEPSIELRTMLMKAYQRSGMVNQVYAQWTKLFDDARQIGNPASVDGNVPKSNVLVRPLSITLDALASKGRYTLIVNTWKSVTKSGFGVDSACYNSYARALARAGNVYGAFWIAEHVLLPRHGAVMRRANKSNRPQSSLETIRPPPPVFSENELLLHDEERLSAELGKDEKGAANYLAQYKGIVPLTASDVAATANAPSKPSDLRPSSRSAFHADAASLGQWNDHDPFDITRRLLEQWRPGDVAWRPSNALRETLSSVYKQLQELSYRHAHVVRLPNTKFTEVGRKLRRPAPIRLPEFGVHVKARGGEWAIDRPASILSNLNHKFPKTVKLLLEWRKRPRFREYFEESESSKELTRFRDSLEKSLSKMDLSAEPKPRKRRRIAYRLRLAINRLKDVRFAKESQVVSDDDAPHITRLRYESAAYQRKGRIQRMRERLAKDRHRVESSRPGSRYRERTWNSRIGLNYARWKRVLKHNEARRMGKISHFKRRFGLRKRRPTYPLTEARAEKIKARKEKWIRKQQVRKWKRRQEEWKTLGVTRSRPKRTASTAKSEVEQEFAEKRAGRGRSKGRKEKKRGRKYRRMTYGTKSE